MPVIASINLTSIFYLSFCLIVEYASMIIPAIMVMAKSSGQWATILPSCGTYTRTYPSNKIPPAVCQILICGRLGMAFSLFFSNSNTRHIPSKNSPPPAINVAADKDNMIQSSSNKVGIQKEYATR